MGEQLFKKFILKGINNSALKVMDTLEKKGYFEKAEGNCKISKDDIEFVLNRNCCSFAEYSLFLRFAKGQYVNYNEPQIQEMILAHKSLSQFALLDKKCPQELKDRIPNNIRPIKPPLSFAEAIKPCHEMPIITKNDENKAPIIKPYIKTDEEFLNKKDMCWKLIRNNFDYEETNMFQLGKNIQNCIDVCSYTDDVNYKKDLYLKLNDFQLSWTTASHVSDVLSKETNGEVLKHVFSKCPKVLEQQTGMFKDSTVICYIKDNPSITKDIAQELVAHYSAQDYCQNKFYLCIAELLIEKGVFPHDAYEYYATNIYHSTNYRRNNAEIIRDKILYDKNTPEDAVKILTQNNNIHISIPAVIRQKTGLCGSELEYISEILQYKTFDDLYNLDDNLKKIIFDKVKDDRSLLYLQTVLCINNKNINIKDVSSGYFDIAFNLLYNRHDNDTYGDPLMAYLIIEEYKNSTAIQYVAAERQYIKDKEAKKETKTLTIVDSVLSEKSESVYSVEVIDSIKDFAKTIESIEER